MPREFKEVTCSECEKSLGYAVNPKAIPQLLCPYCVEWQDDFNVREEA